MEELEACFKVLLIQVIKKLQQLQLYTDSHKNNSVIQETALLHSYKNHYFNKPPTKVK